MNGVSPTVQFLPSPSRSDSPLPACFCGGYPFSSRSSAGGAWPLVDKLDVLFARGAEGGAVELVWERVGSRLAVSVRGVAVVVV
jgi:hypothetical protein